RHPRRQRHHHDRARRALVVGIDDEALRKRNLPLLPAQPALRLVEQPLDLAMLARDARDRNPCALPHVVVVDLGNGRSDAILELGFRTAYEVTLLLQRVRRWKVQLAREHADEAARHQRTKRSTISAAARTVSSSRGDASSSSD